VSQPAKRGSPTTPVSGQPAARRALGALQFFNGLGCFSRVAGNIDIFLYWVRPIDAGAWSNVVSKSVLRLKVAVEGGGYTLVAKSATISSRRLSNDRVSDVRPRCSISRPRTAEICGPTALADRHENGILWWVRTVAVTAVRGSGATASP